MHPDHVTGKILCSATSQLFAENEMNTKKTNG